MDQTYGKIGRIDTGLSEFLLDSHPHTRITSDTLTHD